MPSLEPISTTESEQPTSKKHPEAFSRTDITQLAVRVQLLNGERHTWPYAHLVYHSLEGGLLKIFFSEHLVIVQGRHLKGADEALCLQSLVYLRENGTRQQDALGEPDIPEDQPAIDSIEIIRRPR